MSTIDAHNTELSVPLKTDSQGVVRVGDTKVSLASIIAEFQRGATPEQIVQNFDAIRLEEAYAVVAYYLSNQQSIDAILQVERLEGNRIQRESATRFPQAGIRDRLAARKRD